MWVCLKLEAPPPKKKQQNWRNVESGGCTGKEGAPPGHRLASLRDGAARLLRIQPVRNAALGSVIARGEVPCSW